MIEEQNIKIKVIFGLFWKLMERGGTQGVQFIIQILLARLLLPEDFGIIALISIFITIANVFVQGGFNTALIQKKEADEIDISSVFYLSMFVACLLYMIIFLAAPFISAFFGERQLVPVLRVLSIVLFLNVINSIQNAVVARNMQFKKLFFSSLQAILVSGVVGIVMAYAGYGVWALVGQQLTNQMLICIVLWFTVKWRPKLLFSFHKVKSLFSYGWKLLVSSLIDTLYLNLHSLIVGKMYNSEMLGFYNRGQQFPALIVTNINGSIQSVMLPALSSQQDDRQRVKRMVRRSIVTSSFVIFPMMAGLAAVAEPLVKILLTEKWLPCVPFLQIYCAVFALWPIHTSNLQAINALGRSDIFLKLEIIKKVLGLSILSVTIFYGVYAIAFGVVISGIISTLLNSSPNKKLINYSFKEQWQDIMPPLFLSLIMGLVVYCFNFLGLDALTTIITQIFVGIFLFIGMAYLFKIESLLYLVEEIKNFKN